MLHTENLYQSDTKRIGLSVWKSRQSLVMHLQEWERDAQGFESFVMFGSWSPRVATEACARATKAAVQRFYDAHIGEARELVKARVLALAHADADRIAENDEQAAS